MLTIPHEQAFLPVIQLSITPVILISGLGALLISMTNRMGRIVDRTRALAGQARQAEGGERQHIEHQLKIMFRRAKLMRLATTLVSSSMFVSGLLVIMLFASAFFGLDIAGLILSAFVTGIVLTLWGLAVFIRDLFVSLNALNAEVARALTTPDE